MFGGKCVAENNVDLRSAHWTGFGLRAALSLIGSKKVTGFSVKLCLHVCACVCAGRGVFGPKRGGRLEGRRHPPSPVAWETIAKSRLSRRSSRSWERLPCLLCGIRITGISL